VCFKPKGYLSLCAFAPLRLCVNYLFAGKTNLTQRRKDAKKNERDFETLSK
jgi:hypothetical protein